ncbi:NAD(P)-binding protein [Microthyrium microscopicum]|uniref:NAD(P)-binding protein n=1 Tax=Microthyrium microscopicum TaxID=703497 RepID=A0A6A6U073_9PEZI|nr:NAD(P)-binding protein [Microthyrium microscopicum]
MKVIIVTGASRGIGRAVAKFLLDKKCKVVVAARDGNALDQLRQDYPDNALVVVADFSDLKVGQEVVNAAIKTWGRLDGIVINHGQLAPVNRVGNTTAEQWRQAFDVNFFSAISLVQAALPALRERSGKIIFTSSGAALNAYAAWGPYGASKAAINHLTKTLSVEEPKVITVAIRPGTVNTEMQREIREEYNEEMDDKDLQKFANLKADGELLRPEQPGHVIAKLVLEAPLNFSGKFYSWNDGELENFQDD